MADICEKSSFCIAAHSQDDQLLSTPDKWRRTWTVVQGGQFAEVHARLVPPQPFHDRPAVSPLRPGESLKNRPLIWNYTDVRGWCFQERVLSRAVLHFTPQEVMFEANGCIENCQCGFHTYYMFRYCEVYPERGGLNPSTAGGSNGDLPTSHHIPSFSWASRMGPCGWAAELFDGG
jgi:hypothetical protein